MKKIRNIKRLSTRELKKVVGGSDGVWCGDAGCPYKPGGGNPGIPGLCRHFS